MVRLVKKVRTHWSRLSVDYYRDPKIIMAGPIAELAFVRLLSLARERVEASDVEGSVPYVLAVRELREVTDLWTQVNKTGFNEMLAVLEGEGLIARAGADIIVVGYEKWQTTKEEIDKTREDSRNRQQTHREKKLAAEKDVPDNDDEPEDLEESENERFSSTEEGLRYNPKTGEVIERKKNKANTKTPGGEGEMGVYDSKVEPFTDLRGEGDIKRGKKKIGKHGLDMDQVSEAEVVAEYLVKRRHEVLGGSVAKPTATWWSDIKKLLTGAGDNPAFTSAQICDIIDFAFANKFWHAHLQTPGGIVKHGNKIYISDEFVRWSKNNKRPVENRPRDTFIGNNNATFKGALAADSVQDWGNESENL